MFVMSRSFDHAHKFTSVQVLQSAAKRMLLVPASSTSSERLFSIAGFLSSSRSCNIGDATLQAKLMLRINKRALERKKPSTPSSTPVPSKVTNVNID